MDSSKYYMMHVLEEDGTVKMSMYVGRLLRMYEEGTSISWEFMDDDDTVRKFTDNRPPSVRFEEIKE